MNTDYRFTALCLQLNRLVADFRVLMGDPKVADFDVFMEDLKNVAVMASELERDNQLDEINSSEFNQP